jgi:hypothetical protein
MKLHSMGPIFVLVQYLRVRLEVFTIECSLIMGSTMVGSSLGWMRLEVNGSDKHSSLLRYVIYKGRKVC